MPGTEPNGQSVRAEDSSALKKYVLGPLLRADDTGRLYEAVNRDTSRTVLLRIFDTSKDDGEPRPDWIAQQVRALVTSRCDHLVQILDMETPPSPEHPLYVVMELVRGDSLADRLEREGSLGVKASCRLAIELLQAVEAAHTADVVPLGVEVGDVFLSQWAGQRDFAKILAPTAVEPDPEEGRFSDLRAVGAILFHCLTGRPPEQPVPVAKIEEEISSIAADQGIGEPEAALLAQACKKALLGEYQDPEEMLAELESTELAQSLDTEQSVSFESLPEGALPGGGGDEQATVVDKKTSSAIPLSKTSRPEVPPPPPLRGPPIRRTTALTTMIPALVGLAAGILGTLLVQWLAAGPPGERAAGGGEARPAGEEPRRPPPRVTKQKGPPIKFTIAYNSPPGRVKQQMAKLVQYLRRRLGRPVKLIETPHHEVADLLERGKLDMAVFSPYLYVLSRRQHDRFVLVATHLSDGALTYEGYLVVPDQSPIRSVGDMKGKAFCFVAKTSGSGYLFPKALLLQNGIDPATDFEKIVFSGTHEQAIRDLVAGKCDAAAVASTAYLDAVVNRSAAIRIVAVTERIPGDAYCVSQHLDPTLHKRIERVLVTFDPQRDLGRKFLGKLHRITGFVLVDDKHYDPIRRVHKQLKTGKLVTSRARRPARHRPRPVSR